MIEVAFIGRAGKAPETRVSAKGTPWKALSLAADAGAGEAEWISVSVFGDVADKLPDDLAAGERCYCEGRLRLSRWQAKDGSERSTLQVNATRILVLDRIGRRRKTSRTHTARADSQAPLSGYERAQPSDELTAGEVPR